MTCITALETRRQNAPVGVLYQMSIGRFGECFTNGNEWLHIPPRSNNMDGNIQACSSGILRQNMLEFLLVILDRVQIIVMRWKIPECCPGSLVIFLYCVDQIYVYLTLVGHFC
jgi:hypothetical protein